MRKLKPDGTSRKYGDGSLFRIGDIWYFKYFREGKQIKKSLKTKDFEEAKREADSIMLPFKARNEIETLEIIKAKIATKESEISRAEYDKRKVKYDDILETYFKRGFSPDISPKTRSNYENIFNVLDKWVSENANGIMLMDDFTKSNAEEFLDYLRKKICAESYNYYLKFLKSVWAALGAKSNVWAEVGKYRKATGSKRRSLTFDELNAVFANIDSLRVQRGSSLSVQQVKDEFRMLFLLGLYTGLREGDLAHLKYSEMDMSRRIITKVPHKTMTSSGAAVVIPLVSELYEALKAFPRYDAEYVLPNIKYRYEHGSLKNKIREIFKASGITMGEYDDNGHWKSYCSFHSLRHTFVSMCANKNVPISMVQRIVGHSNRKMTDRYYHEDISVFRQMLNLLPRMNAFGKANRPTDKSGVIEISPDKMTDASYCVELSKSTFEKLRKAAGGRELDDFIDDLLSKKAITDVKKQIDEDLDKMIDEIFEKKK